MENLMGKNVFNKRNSTYGEVVAQDGATVTVSTGGVEKQVTLSTFTRWYRVEAEEQPQAEAAPKPISTEGTTTSRIKAAAPNTAAKPKADKKENKESEPKHANEKQPGVGLELRNKFVSLLKEVADSTKLDITVSDKNRSDIIKYNGKNVFECTYARKRFNVLCHPDSLTPDNLKRANTVFPKEWGWSLRAKFVFEELTQWPLMKTIITDGLFYRDNAPQ